MFYEFKIMKNNELISLEIIDIIEGGKKWMNYIKALLSNGYYITFETKGIKHLNNGIDNFVVSIIAI